MADEPAASKKSKITPPRFEKAPAEVLTMAQEILTAHHADLMKAQVTFDYIFCHAPRKDGEPTGPAIKRAGVAKAGMARIVPLKDRALGRADGEVHLDADQWPNWNDKQRRALVDHELHHFLVRRDKHANIMLDDQNRPILAMRPHDFEFGWFTVIAERYGPDSFEVSQALAMHKRAGDILFPKPALSDTAAP